MKELNMPLKCAVLLLTLNKYYPKHEMLIISYFKRAKTREEKINKLRKN